MLFVGDDWAEAHRMTCAAHPGDSRGRDPPPARGRRELSPPDDTVDISLGGRHADPSWSCRTVSSPEPSMSASRGAQV